MQVDCSPGRSTPQSRMQRAVSRVASTLPPALSRTGSITEQGATNIVPDDILATIFLEMTHLEDKLRLSLVCRRWRAIMNAPENWESVDLSGRRVPLGALLAMIESRPSIARLNLGCTEIVAESASKRLEGPFSVWAPLTWFKAGSRASLPDMPLVAYIGQKLPNLTHLCVQSPVPRANSYRAQQEVRKWLVYDAGSYSFPHLKALNIVRPRSSVFLSGRAWRWRGGGARGSALVVVVWVSGCFRWYGLTELGRPVHRPAPCMRPHNRCSAACKRARSWRH